MPPSDDRRPFQRALRALRQSVHEMADEVTPLGIGFVACTRSLPHVWTLNQLCVTEPAEAATVVGLAEEHQADLPFRHVVVEHAGTAAALEEPLAADGWQVDRLVFQALGGAVPERRAERSAVVMLSEDETVGLMRRWFEEERPGISAAELADLAAYNRREGRRWREVAYGIRGPEGTPVAVTKLRHDGPVWWVEDVYTVPEARRSGHARALVGHAVATARAARPELVFIVADEDDWPQHLYESIGFRRVGTTRVFHRDA